MCVCVTESLYLNQKRTQHCKSTLLQLKKIKDEDEKCLVTIF